MDKVLARYFVKLIAENLQFSFNGMGIPRYSCEWLENQLMQENYDKVKEFIRKRYDEHENSAKDTNVRGKKRKRKFRAMTNAEFCRKWQAKHNNRCFGEFECCPLYYAIGNMCCFSTKSFRLPNGKYILIEVKE